MKIIYKTLKTGLLLSLAMLASCGFEDPVESKTTFYPIIEVNGGEVLLNVDESYTDPGAVATIDGVEVPVDIRFVGRYRNNTSATLDTSISDIYAQEYSATNVDGFSDSATRQVIVANTGDLVTSIEGLYTCTVFRNGSQPSTNPEDYTDIEYMLIWKNADGSYQISDSFGGWYLFGRAIDFSETPGGVIVANDIPSNDFSFPGTQTNRYFGGSSEITALTVDPDTKTLVLTTVWNVSGTTYTFESTLTQVQF